MKPVKYGPFLGVNNRLPDSGLRVDLPQLNWQYLRSAVNVDIDNRRHLVRRKGMTLLQAMTNPHSVPDKSVVGWFGEKGTVVATQDGQVTALMADNVDLIPPQSGVSVVFESDGFLQVRPA